MAGEVEKLWADPEYMARVNEFNAILNQEPTKEWIKTLAGANIKYLPIERLEWLLTSIYGQFNYEVREVRVIEGSITATVRVHLFNPVLGDWFFVDGVGAAAILSGEGDMAVALALPAAKTFAVKDAVEPLGKIFGKDLNRADQIQYDNLSRAKRDKTDFTKTYIAALQKYKGADKDTLKGLVMKGVKEGWTKEITDELDKKLKK
jgi:hypothetical protein